MSDSPVNPKADKAAAAKTAKAQKVRARADAKLTKASLKRKKSDAKRQKANALPMKKFKFKALDDQGKTVTGIEKATTSGAAHMALMQRNLQPSEVVEKRDILKFEITKKLVPRKEVMNFSRQLAVFMRAGIPIMESLEVILEETSGKMLRVVLVDMID